jgi:hypothetical protein
MSKVNSGFWVQGFKLHVIHRQTGIQREWQEWGFPVVSIKGVL